MHLTTVDKGRAGSSYLRKLSGDVIHMLATRGWSGCTAMEKPERMDIGRYQQHLVYETIISFLFDR